MISYIRTLTHSKLNRQKIESWFMELQDRICSNLEQIDDQHKFQEDNWLRPDGGGGRTRVIENANVLERGGCNFSAVHGPTNPQMLKALDLADKASAINTFFACGVSLVMHPRNPNAPIVHMNVRYFELDNGIWWFGGGIDLTPIYVCQDNARFFHNHLKSVCDKFDERYYPDFKKWADDYFFLRHRDETRGIGGIFFDRLNESAGYNSNKNDCWEFVKAIGNAFNEVYTPILLSKCNLPSTEEQRQWQLMRRGRYAEFNLIWDRGTKFGLETNGRTESILMSLPPLATWKYDYQPTTGSAEEATQNLLVKGINWAETTSLNA